jgi:hypothetical protein
MFDDPATVASTAFAFRIGERMVLSAVVILVAVVVCAGFWRSIQKVDFSLAQAGASGSFVLATPVLALLALIGFAWVSFSHPVSVTLPALASEPGAAVVQAPPGGVSMVGALPARTEFERQAVTQNILSLNCIAERSGGPLAQREEDALIAVKIKLMETVWADAWGDPKVLSDWATGFSDTPPPEEAQRIFQRVHPLC